VEEERGKETVDLTRFDWQGPQSFAELDVCISRIGSTLKDKDLIAEWLKMQGYRVLTVKPYGPYSTYDHLKAEIFYISALVAREEFEKNSPIFQNYWFLRRWYGFGDQQTVDVWVLASGDVVGIAAFHNGD
jgi:hypothetical protein